MKLTESANAQIPTSDVERKDFKIMFGMIAVAIVVLIVVLWI